MRNPISDQDVAEVTLSFDASHLLQIASAAIVSIFLGIGIGLFIAWVVMPVEFVNADPSDLRPNYKDDYVRMISAAYVGDGNLAHAQERLDQLGVNFTTSSFSELMMREQKSGRDPQTLDALALLAQAMGFGAMPVPARTAVPDTTVSINPSQTALSNLYFQLTERKVLTCADEPNQARLQFFVRDAQGKDTPNIALEIRWANGEDSVVTGLKPERGAGYADWDAPPGTYAVSISNAQSDVVEDLRIGEAPANCKNDHGQTPRGWKLIFQQK